MSVSRLVSNNNSPHAVVSDLQSELENIDEVYVVYRRKDGDFFEMSSGTVSGLLFAIFLLQRHANEIVDD